MVAINSHCALMLINYCKLPRILSHMQREKHIFSFVLILREMLIVEDTVGTR